MKWATVWARVAAAGAADVALPWLSTVLCGAPLEEAIRSSLLLFIFVHLLISLFPPSPRASLQKVTVSLIGGSGLFYVIAVLFGAPVMTYADQTFLWSLLIATLTTVPLATAGLSLRPYPLAYNRPRAVAAVLGSLGAVLGAWVGAFSIPLDWDRPWQPFPISSTYASLFGHATGLALALFYLLLASTVLRSSTGSPRSHNKKEDSAMQRWIS